MALHPGEAGCKDDEESPTEYESELEATIESAWQALGMGDYEGEEGLADFIAPLKEQVYTPNMWVCDACNFTVSKNILYTQSGNVGSDVRDTDETCPNDGFLLRRYTWRECSETNYKAVLEKLEECTLLKELVERLRQYVRDFQQIAVDRRWMLPDRLQQGALQKDMRDEA